MRNIDIPSHVNALWRTIALELSHITPLPINRSQIEGAFNALAEEFRAESLRATDEHKELSRKYESLRVAADACANELEEMHGHVKLEENCVACACVQAVRGHQVPEVMAQSRIAELQSHKDRTQAVMPKIAALFGIVTPLQLIAAAENDQEDCFDILIKLGAKHIADLERQLVEARNSASIAEAELANAGKLIGRIKQERLAKFSEAFNLQRERDTLREQLAQVTLCLNAASAPISHEDNGKPEKLTLGARIASVVLERNKLRADLAALHGSLIDIHAHIVPDECRIDHENPANALALSVGRMRADLAVVTKERDEVIKDRMRFPDRPDSIGLMIQAHIANRENAITEAQKWAERLQAERDNAQADLAAARKRIDELYSLLEETAYYGSWTCDQIDEWGKRREAALSTQRESETAQQQEPETSAATQQWKVGDHVRFVAEKGLERRQVEYCGHITEQLAPNFWQVVGFGFAAQCTGENMTRMEKRESETAEKGWKQ